MVEYSLPWKVPSGKLRKVSMLNSAADAGNICPIVVVEVLRHLSLNYFDIDCLETNTSVGSPFHHFPKCVLCFVSVRN